MAISWLALSMGATLLAGGSLPATQDRQGGAACGTGSEPSVLVRVTGLKSGTGKVRVQAYGPDPATFLKKGRWVRRMEVEPAGRRTVDVCLALPEPGRYAIAARHDANASGSSDWNDGGGFSRNPRLSLLHTKPAFADVAIAVRPGPAARVDIVMLYRQGLSIGPAKAAD
jgi:uncharacterized protein (DUF2141 family)